MKVRATTAIDQPVSDVFLLMADNRNEPRWNSNLSDSELLTAEPIGLGSRFKAGRCCPCWRRSFVGISPDSS